ncbi:MAG: hypothetical protein AB7P03_28180 [Kofleriaceae bacterium]
MSIVRWFAVWLLVACQSGSSASAERPVSRARQLALTELIGGWGWVLRTSEAGTTRVEREQWRFLPDPATHRMVGRYVRTVDVVSDDRRPFRCNQRPWYRQRAVFELAAEATATGFTIHETDYRTEPGPCDRAFRHAASYTAELDGTRLHLRWDTTDRDTGEQTLWRTDEAPDSLPELPWLASPPLDGAWRWDATSYDDDGNLRDESEWWQLTRRSDTQLDATYRRRVTVRSPDGSPIVCANGPSWSFDDAYVLEGQREEEHWHFHERAVDRGDHPCLAATTSRALDEATAEQLGDHLVLEWRGKRKQILYRPDADAGAGAGAGE